MVTVLLAHAPGEQGRAEELAGPLAAAGYQVWHEGVVLVGESLAEEASRVLLAGGPVVLCGTVAAMGTGFAHRLVHAARASGASVRVFAVQMDKDAYLAPLTLDEKVAAYWQDPADAVAQLLAALRVYYPPAAGSGGGRALFAAPVVTGPVVPRPELFDRLVALLLAPGGAATVGVGTSGLAGLDGTGGFGKTTLAAQACRDPRVVGCFPDGVLWVTVGEDVGGPDLVMKINELAAHLSGTRPPFTDLEQAAQHLGRLLDGGRRLLVVDDVWRRSQMEPFLAGDAGCTKLVTTRVRSLFPPGVPTVHVDAMPAGQARALLTVGLAGADGVDWAPLLDRTGGWPVLLALVNRALHRRMRYSSDLPAAVARVVGELARRGPAVLDVADTGRRHDAVAATVEASLAALAETRPRWADRFVDLAVFAEDADIPLAVLTDYWAATGTVDAGQVETVCEEFADLSLVQQLRLDGPRPSLRLHDVIRGHLRHRPGIDLPALHARLLDAYRRRLPSDGGRTAWWALPPGEPYLWRALARHLQDAALHEELTALMHDLRWATAKIQAVGSVAVGADIDLLPADVHARALGRILRQTGHLFQPTDSLALTTATLAAYAAGVLDLADAVAELRSTAECPLLVPAHPPLPDQPSVALRRTLTGHTSRVSAFAVAPDGSWLASAGRDGTVRIWDPTTGTERAVLAGHTGDVSALAVVAAPGGPWLASAGGNSIGGGDGTVRIWDPTTGTERAVLAGHTGDVSALAVVAAPGGPWLASAGGNSIGGGDGTVRIWDPTTGTERAVLAGHTGDVSALAVVAAPGGPWLASAGRDGTVRIWDPATGTETAVLAGHTGDVSALAVAPDGSWLASASGYMVGGGDGTVRIWDPTTRTEMAVLRGYAGSESALAVAPDGSWLASAGGDGTVRIWDPTTGAASVVLIGHHHVSVLAVAPDGSWLASASRNMIEGGDGTIRVWDSATGTETAVLAGHSHGVSALAVAPDGSWLASTSGDVTRVICS